MTAVVRPTIRRKNLHRRYLTKAQKLAREWSVRYVGIEAIMLTGGVARGYADELSELDLTIFLNPATFRSWVRLSRSPLPEGDGVVDGTWVDIDLTTVPRERERMWEPLQMWDASYAKILFDRRGRLAALLGEKIVPPSDPWELHEEAIIAEWFVELGIGWIDRTDVVAAHHLLNRAFDHFLSLLFGAQGERLPYDKWQLHLVRTLPVLPPKFEKRLREWLSVRSFTAQDVRRRAEAATALLHWWKETFRDAWRRSKTRDAIRALRRGAIPLEKFQRRFGERALLEFPLRAVTSVKREAGRWVVRLEGELLRQGIRKSIAGVPEYLRERLVLAAEP